MSQQKMIRSGAIVALAILAAACDRSRSEDRQTSTSPQAPPARQTQQAPQSAPPPVVEHAETDKEKVGTTETTGANATPQHQQQQQQGAATNPPASTQGTPQATTQANETAPSLPTNLPPFEGELQMKTQGRAPESLDYAMKGDKIRLGISAAPGNKDKGVDAIIDTTDKKATILFNDKKEFVEVDLGKLAQKAKARLENVDVERTGRTDTVSGRQCEEWQIKDRDYQVNACVAKGAPYFDLDALEQSANFKAPSWVHRVVDEGYIPLRVNVSDASGKSLASSQVTETSRKVEPSRFEVPVGYRKADASKLPGMPKK